MSTVYSGHVKDGMVIFDQPVVLPEGIEVRIEVSERLPAMGVEKTPEPALGKKLLKYAGKAVGLPSDAARNHDQYLYGSFEP